MHIRQMFAVALVAGLVACGAPGPDDAALEADAGNEASNAAANALMPSAQPGPATARDGSHYVQLAGAAHAYMIEAATLAGERAQQEEVRTLAGQMLDQHRRAATALEQAASSAEPPVPHEPAMSPYHVEVLESLRGAAPESFDRVFLGRQLEDQERLLTLLTSYAINGDVDALRRQASEAAEPVRETLSRVRDLIVEIPFEEAPDNSGTAPEPAR